MQLCIDGIHFVGYLGYQIKQDKMEISSQEWHCKHKESGLCLPKGNW